MKGFRVPPQPNKKEAQQHLQTELANLQMAGRISQMMTQQLMESVKQMSTDLGYALNQVSELQYKLGAVIKATNLSPEELNKIGNDARLVDFEAASLKQDAKDGLLVGETVQEDSTVTLTSVARDADGEDRGIFRSRIKLSESGAPELNAALLGKKVGDKVSAKLNGVDHEVELLAIRNEPAKEAVLAEEVTH